MSFVFQIKPKLLNFSKNRNKFSCKGYIDENKCIHALMNGLSNSVTMKNG
jgi:hypothetical protein